MDATSGVAMMVLAAYQPLLVLITAAMEESEKYIRAYSAIDVPKLLVPVLEFASAVDDDGMLNCVFHPDELFKTLKTSSRNSKNKKAYGKTPQLLMKTRM